jgi:hypothetical protein
MVSVDEHKLGAATAKRLLDDEYVGRRKKRSVDG